MQVCKQPFWQSSRGHFRSRPLFCRHLLCMSNGLVKAGPLCWANPAPWCWQTGLGKAGSLASAALSLLLVLCLEQSYSHKWTQPHCLNLQHMVGRHVSCLSRKAILLA